MTQELTLKIGHRYTHNHNGKTYEVYDFHTREYDQRDMVSYLCLESRNSYARPVDVFKDRFTPDEEYNAGRDSLGMKAFHIDFYLDQSNIRATMEIVMDAPNGTLVPGGVEDCGLDDLFGVVCDRVGEWMQGMDTEGRCSLVIKK